MARFNHGHNGDSKNDGVVKTVIVPGVIYDLTQMITADCSGLRPAMRQMKTVEARTYMALLKTAVNELEAEVEEAIEKWQTTEE